MDNRSGRLGLLAALALIVLSCVPLPAAAQPADPLQLTVHAVDSARFPRVTAYVTVADSRGIPIDGLTARAFALTEDGQPVPDDQVTVSPSERPDRPVSLVLALDISNSLGEAGVAAVRNAALAMLDGLPPAAHDRIALITFGNPNERSITVEQGFTDDRDRLREIVAGLAIGPQDAYTAFWGAAYDALALLEADPQAAASRRRAVMILTDGVDNSAAGWRLLPENTQRTPDEVVAYAQRLGVPIYPVSFGNQTDEAALEALAAATQGVSYISATPLALEQAFADVLALLRKEYRVDFTSALPADDAEHALELRVTYQAFTSAAQATFTATAHPVEARLNLEEGAQVSGNVLIQPEVSAAAPVAYARLSVNGAPLQEFGAGDIRYTWNTSQLAPGPYTLDLFVRDSAGNTGEAQVTVRVVEPLRVAITAPLAGARLAGEVDVAFEIASNVADVNVVSLLADGREVEARAAPEPGAGAFTWDASAAGLGGHQLEVRARDTLGNQASAAVVVNVVPELAVQVTDPAPNADVSGAVVVGYTAEANVAALQRVALYVDGALYALRQTDDAAGALHWSADLAPLGAHTLEIRARDATGNEASDAVTVNVARPVGLTIDAPAEGARVAGAVEVAFTLTGRPADMAEVRFFVDDLELEEVTAGFELKPGENALTWNAGAVGLGLRRLESA
ncbi:MAG: Ig-like domain-containing protein [Anaerolineae bacterium]|nr:Ig-like domain-containing protein [Anaerolineae bacterium]